MGLGECERENGVADKNRRLEYGVKHMSMHHVIRRVHEMPVMLPVMIAAVKQGCIFFEAHLICPRQCVTNAGSPRGVYQDP